MRIAMYGGALRHWGLLYPNALDEDAPSPGGTELAMMNMARSLARRGHSVTVFAECEPGRYNGVDYVRADYAVPHLSQIETDVVVSWQDAVLFLHPLKTKLRILMSQSANLGLGQAHHYVDRYFSVSRFSANLLLGSDAYADPSKMWITRNGVDPSRFEAAEARAEAAGAARNPHRLVWASSPDRGLHHLLPIFRSVREQVPDAELVVAYNFDNTLASYRQGQPGSTFVRLLELAAQLKDESGVTFLNHVSQPKLADLMVSSGVLVYPCDPVRPTETYCNVISEALAAGMRAIVSDTDCLGENYRSWATLMPLPVDVEDWVGVIIQYMDVNSSRTAEVRRICSYDLVAEEWEAFFTDFLAGREGNPDKSLASARGQFMTRSSA